MSTSRVTVPEDVPQVQVHHLPCSLVGDGGKYSNVTCVPAKRDVYWRPTEENGALTSHFRGREIHGERVELPPNYKGYVINTLEKTKNVQIEGTFDRFTYWNWSVLPSANDPIRQAMEWIDVAEALHGSAEGSGE